MYEHETQEGILQRILDRVNALKDKREGSVIYDATAPASIEFQNLYIALDTILKETFADTASLYYLNQRTSERGITQRLATCAVLKGQFTPTDLDIPIGSRFSCETLNYRVTEKISDGLYRMVCETAGSAGNSCFGTLIPIEYIAGLETAQLTELLIPAEDDEDAESLRKRYFDSLKSQAFGGNVADYMEKVTAIPGVGGIKVTPVWNADIRPASLIPNERVQAWYEEQIASLDPSAAQWLTAVYTAASLKKLTVGGTVRIVVMTADYSSPSETFLDEIQTAVDPTQNAGEGLGLAPIGHVVHVVGVQSVPIDVQATLIYQSGWDWNSTKSSIQTAVDRYLQELCAAWDGTDYLIVRISQLESRILDCPGILDINSTTINGKEANLSLDPEEIPLGGKINGE